jgi:molybdopterin biosynthesis enzyme
MQATEPSLLEDHAVLTRDLKGSIDRELRAAVLRTDEKGSVGRAIEVGGSSDFVSFARATALINVPAGNRSIETGTSVRVVRLPM